MPVNDPTTYNPADITHVDLARIKWHAIGSVEDGGSMRSHLMAVMQIGGADLHLEAFEVTERDGEQNGATGVEDAYDRLYEFAGGDGPFEVVSIESRRYALSLVPFRSQ